MARYDIEFSLEGKVYHTMGKSSYPSDKQIEDNDYDRSIAEDNAFIFIRGVINDCGLEGRPQLNNYSIVKE